MSTILLVDDEPDTLVVLEWLLRAEGFDVESASDGAQALTVIQRDPPDLVVTDYMMPRMDGLQLTARIRDLLDRHVPVILTSAAANLPSPSAGGYDAAVRKPIDFTGFIRVVRELLGSHPPQ